MTSQHISFLFKQPGEAQSHLIARVKALEGELQQACEREAELHRDLCLARAADGGGPEECLRSMSAQVRSVLANIVDGFLSFSRFGKF